MEAVSIPLTNGGFALIDAQDLPLVESRTWRRGAGGYAESGNDRLHQVLVGRELPEIDHHNRNRLDNRRCNLRPCTTSQNQANREALPHSSRYKGVTMQRKTGRFEARIVFRRRSIYLGTFATESDAAKAYDHKAVELFGEFARLNFQ